MGFSVRKYGKDVKAATELALQELNCTIDEVKVTLLEEPSKGFLGIGSKLALVEVEIIEKEEVVEEPVVEVKEEVKKAGRLAMKKIRA